MIKKIQTLMDKHYAQVVEARHYFHENPELGFEEVKTSAKICEILDKHGISYKKGIAKTGILAQVVGTKGTSDKCVLLRGDIDALAMPELADVPYRSKVPNKMHGCGHDGHAAGLIGAALIINELKNEFSGTVKFMFQPAEEGDGGALPMIEEGILENPKVDMAFGCHLWGYEMKDTVHISSGGIFAAPDEFRIKIKGRGGHGSRPDQSISPIIAAGYFITQTQSIIANRVSAFENAVISFGSIHGGSAFNVIPNDVALVGTVRTMSEKVRADIPLFIEQTLEGLKHTHRVDYEFEYIKRFPVLVNDKNATKIAEKAFAKVVGESGVKELREKVMGGEDFAYIAQYVPSCFILVGIMEEEGVYRVHHNPSFCWDDRHMKVLSRGLTQCALDYLDGQN